jgi:hypothetical protein
MQPDHSLRHRERLAVGRRVCPGHGHFLPAEVFHAPELGNEVREVGHALRGMVDVALQIDHRGPLLEHAVAETLIDGCRHFPHVGIALADVQVVADADDIRHEGDHVRRFAHRLPVRDLRRALVEVGHGQPEEVAGRGEAEPGARGVVPELRNREAGIPDPRGDVARAQLLEHGRHLEQRFQLLAALLPGEQEIPTVQLREGFGGERVDHAVDVVRGQ